MDRESGMAESRSSDEGEVFQDADITLPADDASPEHEHEALQDPAETSSSDYESQEQSEPEPVSTPAQPVSQKKPTPPPLPRRQIPAPPPVRRTSSQEIANMNMLHSSNAQLLVHRAERLRLGKALPARGEGHSVQTAAQALFAQFERIRAGQAAARPDIDWDMWAQLILKYEDTVRSKPAEVMRAIQSGIPGPLREVMWPLLSASIARESQLQYSELARSPCPHEKAIRRDVGRTFKKPWLQAIEKRSGAASGP